MGPSGIAWPLVSIGEATAGYPAPGGRILLNKRIVLEPQPIGELTGTWKLVVVDAHAGQHGTLKSFGVHIVPATD